MIHMLLTDQLSETVRSSIKLFRECVQSQALFGNILSCHQVSARTIKGWDTHLAGSTMAFQLVCP